MQAAGLAPWHRLLLAAAFACLCVTALAQGTGSPGTAALQRLIGNDGLGIANIRRSDLEALWGVPETEKPVVPAATSREPVPEPWLLIQYKSRGLTFTTPPGTYGEADPPIAMSHFSPPFDGCTPQGLCIGMPQDAAMAIITAHYTVTGDHASSFGNSGRITGRTYAARNQGWRQTHYLSFGFSEGRLHTMSFQLQPTPLVEGRTLRRTIAWVVLLVIVVVASRVFHRYRKQLAPVWAVARVWFALYVIASAAIGMFALYVLLFR